jgi:Ca2+/Na+ antiporter
MKGFIPRRELLRREGAVFLLALGLLALAAALFPSGLIIGGLPQSGVAPAPWIFVAIQGLLLIFSPFLAGVFLPMLALCFLVLLPYFPMRRHTAMKGLGIGLLSFWVLATLFFRLWFSWP